MIKRTISTNKYVVTEKQVNFNTYCLEKINLPLIDIIIPNKSLKIIHTDDYRACVELATCNQQSSSETGFRWKFASTLTICSTAFNDFAFVNCWRAWYNW